MAGLFDQGGLLGPTRHGGPSGFTDTMMILGPAMMTAGAPGGRGWGALGNIGPAITQQSLMRRAENRQLEQLAQQEATRQQEQARQARLYGLLTGATPEGHTAIPAGAGGPTEAAASVARETPGGLLGGYSPEMRGLMAEAALDNPSAVLGALMKQNQSPKPQLREWEGNLYDFSNPGQPQMVMAGTPEAPEYEFREVGGQLLRTDPTTGTAEVAFAGAPEAQSPIGKLAADYQQFATQLGEQHPLTQAVSFALVAEQMPEQPKPADVRALRKEFTDHSKTYLDSKIALQKVEQAALNPSAAGDISMLIGYMKMLDPGSVVREGEFATAANAGGVDDRVRNMYNRLLTGERLTEDQRTDFLQQSRGVARVYERQQETNEAIFEGLAQRAGMDISDVVLPYRTGEVERPPTAGGGGVPPIPQLQMPTPEQGVNVMNQPAVAADMPEGVIATDPAGNVWVNRGGRWVPQQ